MPARTTREPDRDRDPADRTGPTRGPEAPGMLTVVGAQAAAPTPGPGRGPGLDGGLEAGAGAARDAADVFDADPEAVAIAAADRLLARRRQVSSLLRTLTEARTAQRRELAALPFCPKTIAEAPAALDTAIERARALLTELDRACARVEAEIADDAHAIANAPRPMAPSTTPVSGLAA